MIGAKERAIVEEKPVNPFSWGGPDVWSEFRSIREQMRLDYEDVMLAVGTQRSVTNAQSKAIEAQGRAIEGQEKAILAMEKAIRRMSKSIRRMAAANRRQDEAIISQGEAIERVQAALAKQHDGFEAFMDLVQGHYQDHETRIRAIEAKVFPAA